MPSVTSISKKIEPFYTQPRELLPEKLSEVLTANNIRIGAGNDIMAVGSGGFIERSSLSTSTVTGFDNGEQLINQVTVTSVKSRNILPIIERVVYVGSRAAANILPGGASIDESQFQIVGDFYSPVTAADGSAVAVYQAYNWRYIRNISAGTITLITDVYARYILNQG